jgi:ATP-binding cassette, subfamily B, bacterial HlyB/CyaB
LSVLSLAPPLMLMVVIDRVLANQSMSTLKVLGAALVLIAAFDTVFGYLRRYLTEVATTRIDGRINLHIYDKLLNLPMSFFERMPTGMIDSKLGQIWHIRNFLNGQLFVTLLDLITLIVFLPVLFYLNVPLTFMVLFLGLCIMGIYCAFMPALRRKYGALNLRRAEDGRASGRDGLGHQDDQVARARRVEAASARPAGGRGRRRAPPVRQPRQSAADHREPVRKLI